jgi:hypothetical protein
MLKSLKFCLLGSREKEKKETGKNILQTTLKDILAKILFIGIKLVLISTNSVTAHWAPEIGNVAHLLVHTLDAVN